MNREQIAAVLQDDHRSVRVGHREGEIERLLRRRGGEKAEFLRGCVIDAGADHNQNRPNSYNPFHRR